MKVHLLREDQDFDFQADLPAGHRELVQDLELTMLLAAMANGDKFLTGVCERVLLGCLRDPEAIRYRQRILADCLAQPAVIRELYDIATGALEDKRHLWSTYGGSYQGPSSNLSGATAHLESYVARLRQLRAIAGEHAEKFRSEGLRELFATLLRELDDEYFAEVGYHLKQLRFRSGVLISAGLGPDNSGINLVLRAPGDGRRRWAERLGIGPRTSYAFTLPPRDEAGANILSGLTGRGINLIANAAAQSADHIGSYFTMLRAELGFYIGCLNLIARVLLRRPARCLPGTAVRGTGHGQRRGSRREADGDHHRRQLGREVDVPAQRRRGPAHDAVRAVRDGRLLPGGCGSRYLHPLHPGGGSRHDQRAAGR
jgi:hypothetical protein